MQVPAEFVQADLDTLDSSDDHDNDTLVHGPDAAGVMYEIEHFRILNSKFNHDCQCKAYIRSPEMRSRPLVLQQQPVLGCAADVADAQAERLSEFSSVPGAPVGLAVALAALCA